MSTELVLREIPAATPELAKSLSPEDLREHRQKIAFEVETVLSAYFQPNEAESIKASQLSWWCDTLQDWTIEQVVWALRHWNEKNSRSRPTPGDILAICKAKRGQRIARELESQPQNTETKKKRITAERAAEIIKEARSAPKRMEAVND